MALSISFAERAGDLQRHPEAVVRSSVFSRLGLVASALGWGLLACLGEPALGAAEQSAGTNASRPLKLDAASNLPVVILETTGALGGEQKTPCTVRLVGTKEAEAGGSNAWPGVVKFHGATSQSYPKKSFAVTLAAPTPLLDLRPRAHWVLNAAFIDRALMRHKLSYDLFRSLATSGAGRFAVASRFVEVRLNGGYQGAYLLMERLDRQLLELRSFQSNDVSHACIYKAVDHAANFSQPGHGGYEQREPDLLVKAYWRPLDDFNRFASSAPDAELFDPTNGLAARLDLDNAIDFHLLVLLTSNLDGITKNFIFARDAPTKERPAPRFFFAPWDYDGTFGRNWDASAVVPTAWLSNRLFDRLMGNRAYRERFAARWKKLREREFATATIQGLIDANARTLGDAARRNAARWREAAGHYPDQLTFEQDVTQMKAWADARGSWLDAEIARRAASSR